MIRRIDINATDCLSDAECDKLKGTFLDDSSYGTIIDYDCDIFCEGKPVLRFRKSVFPEDLLTLGWDKCKYMAKASRGRGAAAGPIDPNSVYWSKRDIYWSDKWSAKYMVKDKKTGEMKQSKMRVNNEVASQPIGYYGIQKNLGVNLPCRLSHFTRSNFQTFQESLPFFQHIANNYKELMPDKYQQQLERATLNDFHIEGTPFSTITANRNFRTAVHQDSGDFGGWACLSVLEENKYHGGLFVMPKFKIAINMRHGDLLVADVHQYHGNTELYETEEDKEYNDKYPQQTYKDNLGVGVLGLNNRFSRISFVCYLREDMIKCAGFNKFVISLTDSERRSKWEGTDFKFIDAINGKEELSYDCESCNRMISYHNVRNTPQHLAKTGCFLSHLKVLNHIVEYKLDKCIIVEDDALQVGELPGGLPDDEIIYLGGFIGAAKIKDTRKQSPVIDHKQGINTLDTEKYRMICSLAYYVPKWQIAKEVVQSLMELKRWRAIDISMPKVLKETRYHYPAIFIEEPSKSQIQNNRIDMFANEKYGRSKCKINDSI